LQKVVWLYFTSRLFSAGKEEWVRCRAITGIWRIAYSNEKNAVIEKDYD